MSDGVNIPNIPDVNVPNADVLDGGTNVSDEVNVLDVNASDGVVSDSDEEVDEAGNGRGQLNIS